MPAAGQEWCRRGPRVPAAPGAGAQGGWGGQQLGARCAARPRASHSAGNGPASHCGELGRGTGSHPGGVPIPLGPQDGVLLPRAIPEVGMALLSPDLWRDSVGWRDRDGAEQAAWPVKWLARSHHHPWPPRHHAWGQTRVAPHTPSPIDIGVGGHGCCPQGHTARTGRDPRGCGVPEVALDEAARSPCPHAAPAHLITARPWQAPARPQPGLPSGCKTAATEPAVPPGTCWPGMPGHGAVTSPAAIIPVLGDQATLRKTSPVLRGASPAEYGHVQPCHVPGLFADGVSVGVTRHPPR